jgi:hypothetical protein
MHGFGDVGAGLAIHAVYHRVEGDSQGLSFTNELACAIDQGLMKTYRARETTSDLDPVALFDWDIATDGLVTWVDMFTVFLDLQDPTIYVYVCFGAPIRGLLHNLHGCEIWYLAWLGQQRS